MFDLDPGSVKVKFIALVLAVALIGPGMMGVAAADSYDGPGDFDADEVIEHSEIEIDNSTEQLYVDVILSDKESDLDDADPMVSVFDDEGDLVDDHEFTVDSSDANETVSVDWDVDGDLETGDYEVVISSDNPDIVDDYEIGVLQQTTLVGGSAGGLLDHSIMGIPTVVIVVGAGLVLFLFAGRSN